MDPNKGEWAPSGGSQHGPEPPVGPIPSFPMSRGVEAPIDPLPLGAAENPILPSLSILLPALNEELGLAAVLKRIPQPTLHQPGLAYRIYLLDGHSSDLCSGMWAFVSERLKSLGLTADGFDLEADIFAECALRKIPIVQVPIEYHQRLGEPKLHLREGIRIALALLKKRLRAPSSAPQDESAPEARWVGPAQS